MFGWKKVNDENASKILDFMKKHMQIEDKVIDTLSYSVDLKDHPKGPLPNHGQIKVQWYEEGVLFSLKKWEPRTHSVMDLHLHIGILKVL